MHFIIFLSILFLDPAVPFGGLDEIVPARAARAFDMINEDDLEGFLSFLASDAFLGRNAGTPSNREAAEWIARFFKRIGLEPGGDEGTYLQTFEFRARGAPEERALASNVIGILEGSDPLLAQEAVVLGAHLDHVGARGQATNPGRGGDGQPTDGIWNGADDNASGTSAVIALAQAFAMNRVETARTLVFVLFNAEEHGLYGSKYYVQNPAVPMERTRAMINLDMIGRNPNRPVYVLGGESSEEGLLNDLTERFAETAGLEVTISKDFFGGSDHSPFLSAGVPVLFFFSGLHGDYHQIDDEADRIAYGQVAGVARCAFLLLYELSKPATVVRLNAEYPPLEQDESSRRRILGIRIGRPLSPEEFASLELGPEQGAVRVDSVIQGQPAERAGLEEGDLILSLNGTPLPRKRTASALRSALNGIDDETAIVLDVLREGRRLVFQVGSPEERDREDKP